MKRKHAKSLAILSAQGFDAEGSSQYEMQLADEESLNVYHARERSLAYDIDAEKSASRRASLWQSNPLTGFSTYVAADFMSSLLEF